MNGDAGSSGSGQQEQEEREDEVELLLHRQRPGVEQRLLLGGPGEVAGLLPEEDVRGEQRGGGHALAEVLQRVGQEDQGGHDRRGEEDGEEGREDAADPALVEGEEGEPAGLDITRG